MPSKLLPQTERIVWDEGYSASQAVLDKQFKAEIAYDYNSVLGDWKWTVEKEYDHKPGVCYRVHGGRAASMREAKAIVQGIWDAIQRGEF